MKENKTAKNKSGKTAKNDTTHCKRFIFACLHCLFSQMPRRKLHNAVRFVYNALRYVHNALCFVYNALHYIVFR